MDATDFNFYTQALAGQLESDSYFRTCALPIDVPYNKWIGVGQLLIY